MNSFTGMFPISKNDVNNVSIDISAEQFLEAPVFENQIVRKIRHKDR